MREALLTPHGYALECDEPQALIHALNRIRAKEIDLLPFLEIRYAAPEVWIVRRNPIGDIL